MSKAGDTLRWDKVPRQNARAAAVHAELPQNALVSHVASEGRAAEDIGRVQTLLRHPRLMPHMVPILEHWLAWLTGAPRRSIGKGSLGRRVHALEVMARIGEPVGFPDWTIEKERARDLRREAHKKAEREADRPAWFGRPDLLPKRPPGRSP